ncbi:MAG: hypothetical protein N2204_05470 [Anaerolineae bacterium]|nr:hypothetical protein [Anaerolineae bacterium]
MICQRCTAIAAGMIGFLIGLLIWGLLLGASVRRHEPGLWTLRFQRVIGCGLDYNGPPFKPQITLWLSCDEANSWQLWPPHR